MVDSALMQCSATVSDGNYRWTHYYPCKNKGKVEIDGKWYCAIHDPEKVKARRDEQARKSNAKHDKQVEQWHREAAERATCRGVPTEQLRPGLLKELLDKETE